jgi:pimeloyl-ACP methyl ester carboxylesterase
LPNIIVRGFNLHYMQVEHQFGQHAPDLIMVHGLATHSGFWYYPYAPALAQYFRVTLFDLRGHGNSGMPNEGYGAADMARDLAVLMDTLLIRRAHLIGHSFGGAIAAHFTTLFPDLVESLTLVDTRLRAIEPPNPRRHGQGIGWEILEQLAQQRLAAMVDNRSGLLFAGVGGQRMARKWLRLLAITSARRDFSGGDGMSAEAVAAIRVPVAAIYGENSPALATGKALVRMLPQTRLVTIPNAGHFFPISQREMLLDAFESLLARVPQRELAVL